MVRVHGRPIIYLPAGCWGCERDRLLCLGLVVDGQETRGKGHLLLQVGIVGALFLAPQTPAALGHSEGGSGGASEGGHRAGSQCDVTNTVRPGGLVISLSYIII